MKKLGYIDLLVLALPLAGLACSAEVAGGSGSRSNVTGPSGAPSGMPSGTPTDPGMPTPMPTGTSTVPVVPVQLPPAGALGPIALRRLNKVEYENTVSALGAAPGAASAFADDDPSLGYRNIAGALTVTPLLAEQYAAAAKKLAAGIDLATQAPCDSPTGASATACAQSFISQFGKRAFRRPVSAEELSGYKAIFQERLGRSDYDGAIRLVAEIMLQSPHFLYKTELGEGSGVDRALTGPELASQISYLATGAPPDAELMAAAEAGRLTVPSERETQLRRLLSTPASTSWLTSFVTQWLGIADAGYSVKDQTAFPNYTPTLASGVVEESERFIGKLLTEGNGSLQTLFTASYTQANQELGAHYGLAQLPDDWQQVTLPSTERMGILTQAAFLVANSKAADSFPIRRGKTVRSRLLCGDVPPPPAGLEIMPVELDPNLSTRERFNLHSQSGTACASCHALIDPIGFAFENYDATGAYRTTENGKVIDATGEIKNISAEIDGPVANALELTQRIASSQVLRDCVARESLRWAIGRSTVNTPATDPNVLRDQALIKGLSTRLGTANSDLRELLVAVVLRDEYGFRSDR